MQAPSSPHRRPGRGRCDRGALDLTRAPTLPARTRSIHWDLLAIVLVVVTVLAHLRFQWADTRPPLDLNLAHEALPAVYDGLGANPAYGVLEGLRGVGGWYNLLLAACMRVTGPDPWVMRGFETAWLLLVLLASAGLARARWGPAVAWVPVAVLGSSTSFLTAVRTGWVHVPELALLLVAAILALRDPALRRGGTTAGLAVAGGLAIALRPSGIIWMGLLLPFLLPLGVDRVERERRLASLATILLAWGVGLAASLPQLGSYVLQKVTQQERYAFMLAPGQLWGQVRTGVPLLVLPLLVVCIARLPWRRPGAWDPLVRLALAWLGVPFVLFVGFRAGLDNFPGWIVAGGLLVAWGARSLPRWVVAVPLLAWAGMQAGQWIPPGLPGRAPAWMGSIARTFQPGPDNFLVPWTDLGPAQVVPLLESACGAVADGEPCRIAVDHHLFFPIGEEPGRLPLFLLGLDDVELLGVYEEVGEAAEVPVAALASFTCDHAEAEWTQRHPEIPARREALVLAQGLVPAWTADLGGGCRYVWLVPAG